ncbi:MAG: UvrD-helicase domain-containing protein [Candidatus Omnitrophica bacterium]|jgi:ATP-dependent exoDNAse (exonuclease V) beta subunit|nr:UvrD-helicase domain-containing protein [Candidatus Omnitrophota bacterium]
MNNKIQSPEVVVVEASAGSGKTFALAKRYLQLIVSPAQPPQEIFLRNILAITFTNKATIEMKERILELLKKISLGKFINAEEEKDILGFLQLPSKDLSKKCQLIMDELIKHYNFFQIQTIDSFINAILSGCALNIDRSANFQIKSDYSKHLAYCFDLTLDAALTDKEIYDLLEDFLQHYLFVENRNGWFPKEDILRLIESLFQLSNRHSGSFVPYSGGTSDLIKKRIYIYELIKELSLNFPEGLNANAIRSINNFLKRNNDIFDMADLPICLSVNEVPMNKDKDCEENFERKWKKIHKELTELIELDAIIAYNPYIRLFHKFIYFFRLVSRKEDILFLEELNHKAHLLFSEDLGLPELYYRLAARFRHYLIDEFQDTSRLQWRNLEMMVEDALSTGGSLFYVGDKKQAIYRFRGGESGLFDLVKNDFSPRFNVISKHLINNWRSQKQIVEFNNEIFSRENLRKAIIGCGMAQDLGQENINEVLDVFKDSSQSYQDTNQEGFVSIERIVGKTKQQNYDAVKLKLLELIKELRGRFNYEDIAILARGNDEVELLSAWLLREKIPVESEKTLSISENHLIKEIISLLRFLNSPIDDLSFCSFVMGELFSAASKLTKDQITDFIFTLHKEDKARNISSLYFEFRKQYPQIWQAHFEDLFKNVGFVSPYELTIAIYSRFEVFKNFPNHQAFFMKLLELIKSKEADYVGLGQFLSYLESASIDDLYVDATHSDSVKVLTIHKSKGLEFAVVIVPFLRIDISPESGGRGTSSYVTENEDNNLTLVRITKIHRQYSKTLKAIYGQNYKKACIDELNNIYVALTRSKYELYIFIPERSSNANNKALNFIPKSIATRGRRVKYGIRKKDKQPLIISIPSSDYKDWIISLQNEFKGLVGISLKEKILQGNIMHAVLSKINNCAGCDLNEVMEKAVSFAKDIYPEVADFSQYQQKLSKILTEQEFKEFFYVGGGSIFCEKEIANNFGDLKRIDRLIIKEKDIYVIDYKSSKDREDQYIKQIKEYIAMLKDIYPKHKIKGFLLYMDTMVVKQI